MLSEERINELAEFFYSSSSADDVPLRIAVCAGIAGWDLTRENFKKLMGILATSNNLKGDLSRFLEEL